MTSETQTSLLQRFLTIISEAFPVNPLAGKQHLLAELNPDRFYLENVRALLGVSNRMAKRICNAAVRQGAFVQRVGVLCPDKNIGASAEDEAHLPDHVLCIVERDGEYEEIELPTDSLDRITFYQLSDAEEEAEEHDIPPPPFIYGSSAQNV